jgi:hypothetical protein
LDASLMKDTVPKTAGLGSGELPPTTLLAWLLLVVVVEE